MSKPTLWIETYPYSPICAGSRTLHYLAAMLDAAGVPVAVARLCHYNPRITVRTKPDPDDIAVYPEGTRGNPGGATRIVRWMLYYAEVHFGGDRIPKEECAIVCNWHYVWSARAHCDHPIDDEDVISLPTFEPEWCFPERKEIENVVYYGRVERADYPKIPFDHIELPSVGEPQQQDPSVTDPVVAHFRTLAILRRTKNFFQFHNSTMGEEAFLCGCNVYRVYKHGIESMEFMKEDCAKFARNPQKDMYTALRFAQRVYKFFGVE